MKSNLKAKYAAGLVLIALAFCLTSCSRLEFGALNNGKEDAGQIVFTAQSIPTTLHFMAVGDNLLHGSVYRSAQTADGGFDFSRVYKDIIPYSMQADLAFVNQETPLGGTQLGLSSYPRFNSPQEVGDYLTSIGFNLISHANNHILDKGEEGMVNTLEYWQEKNDVAVAGAYLNEEAASHIPMLEIDGVKIAFLAYTYGSNGLFLPSNSSMSVAYIDRDKIKEDVLRAKKDADIVIVSMHWGAEYQTEPTQEQKDLAQFLAGLGVDIVVGTHPHVIQPVEFIPSGDGGQTLVIYSLGNFVSSQQKAATMLGGMVTAELKINAETKEVSIEQVRFIPLVTQYGASSGNVHVVPWNLYTRQMSKAHGILAYDNQFSYDYLQNLATRTISGEFLDLTTKVQ